MDSKLYSRFSPEWMNETRYILANTIGRKPPPDDDTLVTKTPKSRSYSSYSSSQSSFSSSQHSSQNSDIDIQFGGFTSAARMYNRMYSEPAPKRAKKESEVNPLYAKYAKPIPPVRTTSNASIYSPKAYKKSTPKATTSIKSEPKVKSEPVNKSLSIVENQIKVKAKGVSSTVVKDEE